jgi:hypothetical protein
LWSRQWWWTCLLLCIFSVQDMSYYTWLLGETLSQYDVVSEDENTQTDGSHTIDEVGPYTSHHRCCYPFFTLQKNQEKKSKNIKGYIWRKPRRLPKLVVKDQNKNWKSLRTKMYKIGKIARPNFDWQTTHSV